jgi:endonuclease YncB( thermonuclease family)
MGTFVKTKIITFSLLITLLAIFPCFAHSGRTDKNGGHHNRKTGEYHYHNKVSSKKPILKEITGKVVSVIDGDTIGVMHNGKEVRIRLAHIDCPEKKQPFGKKAKQFTSKLCFGKKVKIKVTEKDKYGRLIGEVYVGWANINKNLVKNGYAWWYRKYSKENSYEKLEKKAKINKLGIWSQKDYISPWDYRKRSQ